jgi:hypothetical protein
MVWKHFLNIWIINPGNRNQFKKAVLQFCTYIHSVVWKKLNIRIINPVNGIQFDIDNYVNTIDKIAILLYHYTMTND